MRSVKRPLESCSWAWRIESTAAELDSEMAESAIGVLSRCVMNEMGLFVS